MEDASVRVGLVRRAESDAANGWPIGTPIATCAGSAFFAKHAQEKQLGLVAAWSLLRSASSLSRWAWSL